MAREPFNPDLAVGGAGEPTGQRGAARRDDAARVYTVAELTRQVKDAIEAALPPTVYVAGELSNCKRHSSGHIYFTLKDESSELAAVMWRGDASRLKFKLEDGLQVVVTGSVSVFERSGRYQLYARRVEPRGVGAIELAFRQLCDKLRQEGLFDARHKQVLPPFPARIAVVTSPTGAAVQDILDTLGRRYPCATVLLYPVSVQGPGAPRSLRDALATLNRRQAEWGGVDVIIVGRGGGSVEDLAAFNDEGVARAIFASRIPIISAVGHETDVTIADLVADVRAATPTAAAELATPRAADVLEEFVFRATRLRRALRHLLELRGAQLATAMRRKPFADGAWLVRDRRDLLERQERAVRAATELRIQQIKLRVQVLLSAIHRLHPQRFVAMQWQRLAEARNALDRGLGTRIRVAERALNLADARVEQSSPRREIAALRAQLVSLVRRIALAVAQCSRRSADRLSASGQRLAALSYQTTLRRGFSITRNKRTGQVVRARADVRRGERIVTEVADGVFESRVQDEKQPELFD